MTQDNQVQQPESPQAPAPEKGSVFEKTWLIILSLVFCFPVGLILMWTKAKWGTGAKVAVTIVVCALAFASIGSQPDSAKQEPVATTSQPAAESAPAPPKPTPSPVPAKQQAFTKAVESYFSSYKQAPNELKKSALRTQRSQAIKKALGSSKAVNGWTGTLKGMATNSEGKAYISIKLDGSDVRVQCWNNALSDIMDKTLIDQGSKMFTAISDLSKGNKVVFSGEFVKGDKDWIGEQSMTESGAMTDPEFTFRFSSVKRR